MREIVLVVAAEALDGVLDRLLPLVPDGVRERRRGERRVELTMRGAELPETTRIEGALAGIAHEISERHISDDWRERRLAEYRLAPIGGRLAVRPPWAPAVGGDMIEIVLGEGGAFGQATHPTTRGCLEMLLDLAPRGSFADLGCGTGVLAILACRLGWSPVCAIDLQPGSVQAAAENAARNGVTIATRVANLLHESASAFDGFAANVPAPVHVRIASGWRRAEAPATGLISGLGPHEAPAVVAAYARCGLRERRRVELQGWVISELIRG
jgi:ribosomal protein L11 methyltransferase